MHRKIIPYLDDIEAILEGKFRLPITCEIDPSNRCQNECNFCMYANYRKENPVDLDFGVYLNLINNLRKLGVKSITFTGGGEPLVHPEIRNMILAAQDFELGLTTNGIFLNRVFDLLGHFEWVRISLDAATSKTYRLLKGTDFFNRVIDNVKIALDEKIELIDIGLSYVISKGNEHEIEKAQILAKDLGVDYIQIKPAYQKYDLNYCISGNNQSFVLKRYVASTGVPCAAAHLIGIVGADANVYYCCQGRGRKEFVVGTIKYGASFEQIWMNRMEMNPQCHVKTCRYMNYAKGYERYSKQSNTILRHKNFL